MQLTFKPVDLQRDRDLCIAFRRDSFVVSFGDAKRFDEECGEQGEKYIAYLERLIQLDPNYVVHVFEGDRIVGQMEMGPYKPDPERTGYINLYYLIPEMRGKGYGEQLDVYAIAYLKSKGFSSARLSVSATNVHAISFYLKMGWRDMGERPGHPGLRMMEREL